jgi:hypothetical protein
MGARGYLNTMAQFENLYYRHPELLGQLADGSVPWLQKDAQYNTDVGGIYNAVFGRMAWTQLNLESNAFGVLPKYPWVTSGWRVHSARGYTQTTGDSETQRGFIGQTGTLPATHRETFTEASTTPKQIATNFDVSEIMEALASQSNDDHIGNLEYLKPVYSARHRENINQQLLQDVDTIATNGFQSLDRVCGSYSEATAILSATTDVNIYTFTNRGGSPNIYDAQVNHNSNIDRDLTDALIRTMIASIGEAGGETTVILTGWDTDATLKGIYDTQVRYNPLDHTQVKLGVNGIESQRGLGVGLGVNSLYGYPVVVSKDVQKDTLSRMYFLDTSDPEGYGIPRLGFKVLKPTQYFEAGIDSSVPETTFGLNGLRSEGMFRTSGELICRRFNTQGKIRDLR